MSDTKHLRELLADARWYAVSKDGATTLCVDEKDALHEAIKADLDWPQQAPCRAMRLVDARPFAAFLDECDSGPTIDRWKARLDSAKKEISALKHDIGEYVRISNDLGAENRVLLDEIERLKTVAHGFVDEIERKDAEVARLREALQLLLHEVDESAIAGAQDYGWPSAVAKSRAALSPTPGNPTPTGVSA